jgi:hypothetical protein
MPNEIAFILVEETEVQRGDATQDQANKISSVSQAED